MNKPFFSIKNEYGSPVINITGEIGYDVNYTQFRNAIVDLVARGHRSIKMVINSVGGDMVDGFAMYDFIKSQNLVVEVEIIGMAASMAGVLAQCASPGMLGMHENALKMTHRPQSTSRGESDNHRTAADLSDKLEAKAKAIYLARGANEAKMKDWFKPGQMKWFTAEEALAAGIIDRIIKNNGAKPVKPVASVRDCKDEVSAYRFYNSIFTNNHKISMNKLLVSVVLMLNNAGVTNVTIDSTEEDVVAALNKFAKDNSAIITNLKNQVAAAAKTRATDLVASYKAMGKLPADMKAEDETKWVERAEKDAEGFAALMALVPGTTPAATNTKVVDFNAALKDATKDTQTTASANGLPTNKADWNIRQWEQNDPKGLRNMLANNRADYHKLYKAFYGSEPFSLTA